MNHLLKTTVFIFLVISMFSCQDDSKENTTSTDNNNPVAAPVKSIATDGKLIGYRDNTCTIEGKDPIQFSEFDTGVATLIILRPAETLPARTSLSPLGITRAQELSYAFVYSGIEQVYVEGNASLQTSTFVTRSNKNCNVGAFDDDRLGNEEFVKFVLHNWKNKKVMIIGNATMMTSIMRQLSGTNKHVVPADEYDHVFIVRAKALGDSEVYHFTYGGNQ